MTEKDEGCNKVEEAWESRYDKVPLYFLCHSLFLFTRPPHLHARMHNSLSSNITQTQTTNSTVFRDSLEAPQDLAWISGAEERTQRLPAPQPRRVRHLPS
jgi:hypothetical protein